MNSKTLKLLALASGLGTGCLSDSGTSSTGTDSTAGTDTGSGTVDPTNSTPPTSSDPTVTSTTPSTDPTMSTGTTDPGTGSTGTTDTDTGSTTDTPTTTLCERLGGMGDAGIPALVNGLLGQVLVDDKINGYFLNSDVDGGALGACVVKQLGAVAGCDGVVYDCKSMKDAHAGLKISQQDFDDFVTDFVAAYDQHAANHPDLTADDKATISGELGKLAGDIVEDPSNNLTVYQRAGRKPAIEALIGHPMEAGSFVDNVAGDAAINSFFAAADFERLNTCLTRQVSSIDGPVKYGLEVDAPAGTDPGVTLADPCRDMKTSHSGLMDDAMTPITIDDFMALITDLSVAMETFKVDPADQMAILDVLRPMCDDIVADPNTCPGNYQSETVEAVGINIAIDNLGPKWDDKYNGTLASMLCTDLVFPESELSFVGGMSLKVGMDHAYVGDLTIKIVAPDMKVFTPLSRPGTGPEQPLPDNGSSFGGDDSDLSAAFPIVLTNTAATPGNEMGKSIGSLKVICKDEVPKLVPCEFRPYPGLAPGVDFNDFKGSPVAGNWKVCIGDSGKGDYGKLVSLGLTVNRVKYAPN